MKTVGYARVSTDDQNTGLQIDALERAGCDSILEDRGHSGTILAKKRPALNFALETLVEGDVLVVWRLDRLGRSLADLISTVQELSDRGIGFRSLSDSIDTTTAAGKFFFHVMGAMAQFERDLISERTKAGLEAARVRGAKIGRPRSVDPEFLRLAAMRIGAGERVNAVAGDLGVSRVTLWRELKGLAEADGVQFRRWKRHPDASRAASDS